MSTNRIRRGGFALLAAGLLVATGACGAMNQLRGGQTTPLANTARVPAATGQVTTKVGDDGNTEFTVNVEHLAPPDRVQPGANTYVVWIIPMEGNQTPGNMTESNRPGYGTASGNEQPQNVGALQVDRGNLTGSLKGITPFHRFQLAITAESNLATQQPTGQHVLTAQVFQGQQ